MKRHIHIAADALNLREVMGLSPEEPVGDLVSLLMQHGYHYEEQAFPERFAGFSADLGNGEVLIGFNTNQHWNDGFKRFTLGHELGHTCIPRHTTVLRGQAHKSFPEYQSDDELEQEADFFAINFLAPKTAASPLARGHDFSPSTVRLFARHFGLSYYAAVRRLIEITDLPCALIVCTLDGRIRYEVRSQALRSSMYHPFLYRQAIPAGTVMADHLAGLDDIEDDVSFRLWYPELESDVPATEFVMPLGYNKIVFVMLTPHASDF